MLSCFQNHTSGIPARSATHLLLLLPSRPGTQSGKSSPLLYQGMLSHSGPFQAAFTVLGFFFFFSYGQGFVLAHLIHPKWLGHGLAYAKWSAQSWHTCEQWEAGTANISVFQPMSSVGPAWVWPVEEGGRPLAWRMCILTITSACRVAWSGRLYIPYKVEPRTGFSMAETMLP